MVSSQFKCVFSQVQVNFKLSDFPIGNSSAGLVRKNQQSSVLENHGPHILSGGVTTPRLLERGASVRWGDRQSCYPFYAVAVVRLEPFMACDSSWFPISSASCLGSCTGFMNFLALDISLPLCSSVLCPVPSGTAKQLQSYKVPETWYSGSRARSTPFVQVPGGVPQGE